MIKKERIRREGSGKRKKEIRERRLELRVKMLAGRMDWECTRMGNYYTRGK
jgi:hypothetical protein